MDSTDLLSVPDLSMDDSADGANKAAWKRLGLSQRMINRLSASSGGRLSSAVASEKTSQSKRKGLSVPVPKYHIEPPTKLTKHQFDTEVAKVSNKKLEQIKEERKRRYIPLF